MPLSLEAITGFKIPDQRSFYQPNSKIMFLNFLISVLIQTINNNQVSQTKPGEYVEMVRSDFDASSNTTYLMMERYDVNDADHGNSYRIDWVGLYKFPGQPDKQTMLKTIFSDPGIETIGISK